MHYYRRFRMEFDFAERELPPVRLPEAFELLPWDPRDLLRHAATKYECFRDEVDSRLFPSLGTAAGCERLMLEIVSQKSFLPAATFLLAKRPNRSGFTEDCGTIQGLGLSGDSGSIQNVGVLPQYRGYGLGRSLVAAALHGFRRVGVQRVYLEATAENLPAIQLYRSLGFRLIRTTYREVPELAAQESK